MEDEVDASTFVAGAAAGEIVVPPEDGASEPLVEQTVPVEVDGRRYTVKVWLPDAPVATRAASGGARPRPKPSAAAGGGGASGDGTVSAPMQGTIVKVANTNTQLNYEVGRIVADKAKKQLRIYDTRDRLVASYPATIGSDATPSPVGTHTVERVALNPEYTYNPKINFKQGNNDKVLRIPPGPNGPVGSVWIALSKPTYGIHGTPDPEKIGKTYSNGCIRLTNWDAEELARRVTKGVTVEFI